MIYHLVDIIRAHSRFKLLVLQGRSWPPVIEYLLLFVKTLEAKKIVHTLKNTCLYNCVTFTLIFFSNFIMKGDKYEQRGLVLPRNTLFFSFRREWLRNLLPVKNCSAIQFPVRKLYLLSKCAITEKNKLTQFTQVPFWVLILMEMSYIGNFISLKSIFKHCGELQQWTVKVDIVIFFFFLFFSCFCCFIFCCFFLLVIIQNNTLIFFVYSNEGVLSEGSP